MRRKVWCLLLIAIFVPNDYTRPLPDVRPTVTVDEFSLAPKLPLPMELLAPMPLWVDAPKREALLDICQLHVPVLVTTAAAAALDLPYDV